MPNRPRDVAQIRLDNALALFDEFVRATVKHPDAATLRGLEGRFAERLMIQPSYWSQIKSRSRQIGEKLARQFEQRCHKPWGWLDQAHGDGEPAAAGLAGAWPALSGPGAGPGSDLGAAQGSANVGDDRQPRDDDERFIVGLVLTYYRRHPQRARTRLLDLLGEVLMPSAAATPPGAKAASKPPPAVEDTRDLWLKAQRDVAPLKQKKR